MKRSLAAGLFMAVIAMTFFVGGASVSAQQQVRVTIENLQTNSASGDGFYFTPVFVGFDNGSFNLFDAGQNLASGAALEVLAEEGNTAPLAGLFNAGANTQSATITRPGGLGPGLFNPGSSTFSDFTLAAGQTHLNFATMLIPTNDAFLGTDNSINLFDGSGDFQGADITLTLANVWDAGTEVNNRQGAPFSNFGGTASTDEDIGIALHSELAQYDSDTDVAGAAGFQNGAGQNVDFVPGSNILRIRVSAVPEPATGLLGFIALGCGVLFGRRRRS